MILRTTNAQRLYSRPKRFTPRHAKPSHVFRHASRHDLVFYALSSESVPQVLLSDFPLQSLPVLHFMSIEFSYQWFRFYDMTALCFLLVFVRKLFHVSALIDGDHRARLKPAVRIMIGI
jgi:hypothetical protein